MIYYHSLELINSFYSKLFIKKRGYGSPKFRTDEKGHELKAHDSFFGCILNPGHGKIPTLDFNFYTQKDKYLT